MEDESFADIVKRNDIIKAKFLLSKKGELHHVFFKHLVKLWIDEQTTTQETYILLIIKHMTNEMFYVFRDYLNKMSPYVLWECGDEEVDIDRVVFFIENDLFVDHGVKSVNYNKKEKFRLIRPFFEHNVIKKIHWHILSHCETNEDIHMCLLPTTESRIRDMYALCDEDPTFESVLKKLYNYFKYEKSREYFETFKKEITRLIKYDNFSEHIIIRRVMFESPFPTKEMKELRDELFPSEKETGFFGKLFK